MRMTWVSAIAVGLEFLGIGSASLGASETADRGLLMRLYSFEGGVSHVPDLAPGQSASEQMVIQTIDLKGGAFGTLKENFVAELEGILRVDKAGDHALRLSSDDGSLLYVGGSLVLDNDGAHGFTPKVTELTLSAGDNPIRIRYYQGGGDAALRLEWKTPGTTEWSVIPADAFGDAPPAARPAEPGKKKIIMPLRRGKPGDGSPLIDTHPAFSSGGGSISLDDSLVYERGMIRSALDGGIPTTIWVPNLDRGLDGTAVMRIPDETRPDGKIVYIAPFQFQAPAVGEVLRVGLDEFHKSRQGFVTRFSKGPIVFGKTGRIVFEISNVRVVQNGFEISFSEPLDPRCGWEPETIAIEQWPIVADGSPPQRDGVQYPAKSCSVSDDRKTVFVEVENLKRMHIVYLRLLAPWVSESGKPVRATEVWYTLMNLPENRRGTPRQRPAEPPQNTLTDAEKSEGWQLLFDGKTTAGWHNFKKSEISQGWQAINGCLVHVGGGGDIVTNEEYDSFELKIDWRISPAGNSGIFYRVSEAEPNRWVFETGPEMQVLDNSEHADGRNPLTSAGSNYALIAPPRDVTRPVGFFNEARVVVRGQQVEHWLNGEKLLNYELGGDDWKKLVEASKFKSMPRYGTMKSGRIALQDHGDRVWYRNIKIRRLN